MHIRVDYSTIEQQYILGDGRRIPDSQVNLGGADKFQAILNAAERKGGSWICNKRDIDEFYQTTESLGVRCRQHRRNIFSKEVT